jgi:hypothetical protein
VRITWRVMLLAGFLAGTWAAGAPRAAAQNPDEMLPDESAAKAKELIQQAIQGLGGSAYLNVHDVTCTGRLSQFGHSGELNGFATFVDYTIPPNKDRTENLPKRNLIQVMNGTKGWVLDRGGVSPAAETDVATYQDDVRKDIDNILRHRVTEPGMTFRYGGPDVVDLKEADWVELVDSENRTVRFAIARSTHLPIRKVVISRDKDTRTKIDELEYYSNYHPISGIETPYQITRERSGIKVYQVFFEKCEYNTNLSDSLFTRESLDERWAKVGKKPKDKKQKNDKGN